MDGQSRKSHEPARLDPTDRFTSRVDEYVRGRPSYPREIVQLLARESGLSPHSKIADVGSGTGLLSELFLESDYSVACIEPNAAMRAAAEAYLSRFSKFVSIDGRAEATGLPDASIDLVTAAQAFHWFQSDAARQEFFRILRPPRWVALIWNERQAAQSPFMQEYEALVHRHATEGLIVDHERIRVESIPNFFRHNQSKERGLAYSEYMDWPRIRGRLLSTSRMPRQGQNGFQSMMDDLEQLYRKHQVDGRVTFSYATHLYFGTL